MQIDELGREGCMLRLPCRGATGETRGISVNECDRYEPVTEEQIQAELKQWDETKACIFSGISSCCKAPLDESQVITEGPRKNHGRRFCSKCGKLVFMV